MRKAAKIVGWIVASLALLLVILFVYVVSVSSVDPPQVPDSSVQSLERVETDSGFYTIGNNWFRHSESGLYEVYVEGDPYERGVVLGKLTAELVQHQEDVFTAQLNQIVPSAFYRKFLTYFIGWFNRNIDTYIPEENKLEILGVSQATSRAYDYIAPPYQRILNYHGAHDIGHALQNMSLVGCTAFAGWNSMSADRSLIIGRNFDFFVGEEFARDKLIAFYKPSAGHSFMTVTWGGMTGVLSGMNAEGLTITLNAAKSDVPGGAAMPVSLLARQILQYAANIEEATRIARQYKTFVAESFLIGSARDKRAVVIEKSPEAMAVFRTDTDWIIDTNHYQSDSLGNTELNLEHMKTSASVYRYNRVKELLLPQKLTIENTAELLRNQQGMSGANIGIGNEKAINQLIAHHSIIFQPEKRLVWVSTTPWQMGKYVAYDLNKIFANKKTDNNEVYEASLTIPADTTFGGKQLSHYLKYFNYRFPFQPHGEVNADSIVSWNPELYHVYMLAGDCEMELKNYQRAITFYETGLQKEVATEQERNYMVKRLEECKSKLK